MAVAKTVADNTAGLYGPPLDEGGWGGIYADMIRKLESGEYRLYSRPQMDVWFRKDAGTLSREAYVRSTGSTFIQCALSRARHQTSRFLLTTDWVENRVRQARPPIGSTR